MFNFVLVVGVVLVLYILFMLFRVGTLLGVAKGEHHKRETSWNHFNGIMLFVIFLAGTFAFFWYSITAHDRYTMPVASEHGVVTDDMFWVTTLITGIVFILANALLFYFSFRYRFKENNKATFYPDNHKLEIIWTIIPAIVLTLLVLRGLEVWTDITAPAPEEAEVVEVMGYQFAWGARYPGKDGKLGDYNYQLIDNINAFGMDFSDKASFDDFVPQEIHIPKGKPVLLKIRARDVLHSVFMPHFRLKMDAVPGMPTRFWFVPTKTTEEMRAETGNPEFNYELACTEICGRGHFAMRLLVVVDEPEDYEKWYAEQQIWLSQNPTYLSKVPEQLQELALISSGIKKKEENLDR